MLDKKKKKIIIAVLGVWGVITYFAVDLKYFCSFGWISSLSHLKHDCVSSLIVNCLPNCPSDCLRLKLTQTNKLAKFNLKKKIKKTLNTSKCLLLWVNRYLWHVCFLKKCFWLFINFLLLIGRLFRWLLLTFLVLIAEG